MNPIPDFRRALGCGIATAVLVAVAAGAASIASAQTLRQSQRPQTPTPTQTEAQTPTQTVDPNELFREQVAKPLQAAEDLIKAGKYQEAMAKIHEAEQIAGRTPLEAYLIERTRGIAAAGLGDTQTAVKSFEVVGVERLPALLALVRALDVVTVAIGAKDHG